MLLCKYWLCISLLFLLTVISMHSFSSPTPASDHIPEEFRDLMPVGDDFPGSVADEAERVTETIRFSLHPRDFSELKLREPPKSRISTGLYQVPGEPVSVTATRLSNSTVMPWLRIGAHTDNLSKLTSPCRVAIASDSFKLNETKITGWDWASGLIYLENYFNGTAEFEVTIEGAVRAPWFKLGRDTTIEWGTRIRHYPAPWAELEGEHAILTLPSAMIRNLGDPTPIIKAYDQLIKDANELAGLSPDAEDIRHRSPDLPYRFVVDCQTKYDKFSYSGSPIVFHWLQYFNAKQGNSRIIATGVPSDFIDPYTTLHGYIARHELGHNYEPKLPPRLIPGGQGLANLFIYAHRYRQGYRGSDIHSTWSVDICYLGSWFGPATRTYSHAGSCMREYSTTIELEGKGGAFLSTLIDRLSPQVITDFYRLYRERESVRTGSDGNDYFLELLSEASGYNLAPLFRQWGVPFSSNVERELLGKYPCLFHEGL